MKDSINARWLCWSLTGIAFMLAVIAVELSVLLGPIVPEAKAQIPDSGLQRKQLLASQAKTNATLGQILQHLRTRSIKVEVVGTDKEVKPKPKPAKAKTPFLKK